MPRPYWNMDTPVSDYIIGWRGWYLGWTREQIPQTPDCLRGWDRHHLASYKSSQNL